MTTNIQEAKTELGKTTAKTMLFFFVGVPLAIFLLAGLFVAL
jgi:hypothetical protein